MSRTVAPRYVIHRLMPAFAERDGCDASDARIPVDTDPIR